MIIRFLFCGSFHCFILLLFLSCSYRTDRKNVVIDGKKQGFWVEYDDQGILLFEDFYVDDTLKIRKEFYKNGILKIYSERINNIKHGLTEVYYHNGILKNKKNYIKGSPRGKVQDFTFQGRLETEYEFDSDNNEMINFKQYYPNEKLQFYTKTLDEGVMEVYDSLGNKCYDVLREKGKVVDTIKVYYNDCQL